MKRPWGLVDVAGSAVHWHTMVVHICITWDTSTHSEGLSIFTTTHRERLTLTNIPTGKLGVLADAMAGKVSKQSAMPSVMPTTHKQTEPALRVFVVVTKDTATSPPLEDDKWEEGGGGD
jgi:hypothetical protein